MKTLKEWENSGMDLDNFLTEPCEIDRDLYYRIFDSAPASLFGNSSNIAQCLDAIDSIHGISDVIFTYITVTECNNKFFFLGVLPEFKE